MKRHSLLIILLTMLAFNVLAQSQDTRRWHFGAMVGPQFLTQVPKEKTLPWVNGIMVAADVSYQFQESRRGFSLHFQPGVNRYQYKTKDGENNPNFWMEWQWKGYTAHLPLLVRYTFTDGKVRPFAELGANWRENLKWKMRSKGMACQNLNQCVMLGNDEESIELSNNARFGALMSAGVEVDLGSVTIPLTVRVVETIRKKEYVYDPVINASYLIPKPRIIQVSAGFQF